MKAYRLLVATGCVCLCLSASAQSEREMNDKASALTKLSAAVEATVRFRQPSPLLSEDQLLKLSTAHDPRLLSYFAGYSVRVLREQRRAVVLVCTPPGDRALLEDAACTLKLDRPHWKSSPHMPCEFSIHTASVCGG